MSERSDVSPASTTGDHPAVHLRNYDRPKHLLSCGLVSIGQPGTTHCTCGAAAYPAGEVGVYDIGNRHFVVPYGEAGYRWWHDCPAVEHVSWGWIGRVSAERESGHRIVHHAPSLTVEGSLICPDCGDHGFIRDMRWVAA